VLRRRSPAEMSGLLSPGTLLNIADVDIFCLILSSFFEMSGKCNLFFIGRKSKLDLVEKIWRIIHGNGCERCKAKK